MKKLIVLLLALTMLVAFAGCNNEPAPTEGPTETQAPTESTEAPVEAMSHEEFVAAEMEAEVVIETYVQAVESWWDGKVNVYAMSEDGGYYIYGLACTEEEAAKFVPGTKIRVTGHKTEWSGEVEIIDAKYEILDAEPMIFEAVDVTEVAATEELANYMNSLVAINGLTVEASKDADGNEVPYLYKWDGSGSQGDDLYFNVSIGGQTYTFTVNAYMLGTGADSEVYQTIESLKIGDVINVEGFLYWYEGPQPHITSVTVEPMTHEAYVAAELDTQVTVETYVQAIESWYNGCVQVYAMSEDGGYYIYNLSCSEEEAAKFVPGTKIRVTGFKAEWSGEVEIVDASYEILDAEPMIFEAVDVTDIAASEELANYMNSLVAINGLTVEASKDANGNDAAFLYKWDGSGSQGDDLYFNVSIGGQTYTFTVNVYMLGTGADSEVYKAIEALEIGDVINIEGFLYWYNAPQPHVTAVTVVE